MVIIHAICSTFQFNWTVTVATLTCLHMDNIVYFLLLIYLYCSKAVLIRGVHISEYLYISLKLTG